MAAKRAARRFAGAPLTRERLLQAAVSLADADGLEAVTMRSLARRLGVEAMSLYHHVANKDAVLDGVVDLVFADIVLPAGPGWRAVMRCRAIALREALTRHPWAVGLLESRRSPGPATLEHHDAAVACMRRDGFSLRLVAHALAVLDSYVYGFAVEEQSLPLESPEEIEAVATPLLGSMRPDQYPSLVELMAGHVLMPGYSFSSEFDYGLDLILDALDARARAERTSSGQRDPRRRR